MGRSRWLLLIAILSLLAPGCVRRRMTVRSSPAGATVYIDNQQIGTTPVSTPFVYYGTREIQLVKDGYETLTVKQKFKPPWYQVPGVDFVTENLVPYEFRDERIIDFELQTQRVVPTNELMERAEQLRRSTQQGYTVVPPSPTRDVRELGNAPTAAEANEPPVDERLLPPAYYPE